MRRPAVCVFLGCALAWAGGAACSSVPDIRFVDDDASSSVQDAEPDAMAKQDASAADGKAPGCPDEAPENAVCCGTKLCLGCKLIDCFECAALITCAGTEAEACCNRESGRMSCRAAQSCR